MRWFGEREMYDAILDLRELRQKADEAKVDFETYCQRDIDHIESPRFRHSRRR